MLAGLLFAVRDAEDRPDRLAATLPFAGSTLIEYQARLLAAAGASQIVVVVAKLTPDLLGAISRIGRRGVAVDAVRTAAEAAEKLHPLSRVLVLADGLVAADSVVRHLAGEGAEALLVVAEEEAGSAFERIGGRLAWAGAARLSQARLQDVATMPRDYDLQSALLRAASQAGVAHLLLPPTALAEGHGIEHRSAALEARGRTVLQAAMSGARGWFDRWVVAPIGRWTLPSLVTRGMPSVGLIAAGAIIGLSGLTTLWFDWPAVGLALVLIGFIGGTLGVTLARLRDELGLARVQFIWSTIIPALAALVLGIGLSERAADASALITAIALVTFGALGERAVAGRERLALWGSPGGYLLVILVGAALGAPLAGLSVATIYAAATLSFAIEALRRQA